MKKIFAKEYSVTQVKMHAAKAIALTGTVLTIDDHALTHSHSTPFVPRR